MVLSFGLVDSIPLRRSAAFYFSIHQSMEFGVVSTFGLSKSLPLPTISNHSAHSLSEEEPLGVSALLLEDEVVPSASVSHF